MNALGLEKDASCSNVRYSSYACIIIAEMLLYGINKCYIFKLCICMYNNSYNSKQIVQWQWHNAMLNVRHMLTNMAHPVMPHVAQIK